MKKSIKDIPLSKISEQKQTINYKPSDITINIGGNDVNEENIKRLREEIERSREEELRVLRQRIGGGLANA